MTQLDEQGVAERYDIVIDFSAFRPGDSLYFLNLLKQDRRPEAGWRGIDRKALRELRRSLCRSYPGIPCRLLDEERRRSDHDIHRRQPGPKR